MWCVLTDNYSATNILDVCKNPESKVYKEDYYVQKFLYALSLWEGIYRAPRKSFSSSVFTKVSREYQENELIKRVKNIIFDFPYEDMINEVATKFYEEWYEGEYDRKNEEIKRDAIFYVTLGQIENMNTLLSEQRAKYVKESGISKKIWSRENILEYIDKEVFDIYREVYSYFGKSFIRVKTPLLIDYICENATCLRDAFDIAFQLRKHKHLVSFRETMNSLDNAINFGNILKVKEYWKTLSEIINQFVEKDLPTEKIDIELTFTPSITQPAFSASFGIPYGFNGKRKINMNFLIELMKYGLSGEYQEINWT